MIGVLIIVLIVVFLIMNGLYQRDVEGPKAVEELKKESNMDSERLKPPPDIQAREIANSIVSVEEYMKYERLHRDAENKWMSTDDKIIENEVRLIKEFYNRVLKYAGENIIGYEVTLGKEIFATADEAEQHLEESWHEVRPVHLLSLVVNSDEYDKFMEEDYLDEEE